MRTLAGMWRPAGPWPGLCTKAIRAPSQVCGQFCQAELGHWDPLSEWDTGGVPPGLKRHFLGAKRPLETKAGDSVGGTEWGRAEAPTVGRQEETRVHLPGGAEVGLDFIPLGVEPAAMDETRPDIQHIVALLGGGQRE